MLPDEDDELEGRGTRDILRRPEAKAAFLKARAAPWAVALVECGDRIYRRLGMKLLIREVVDAVDPSWAIRHSYSAPLGVRDRGRSSYATCSSCGEIVSVKKDGTFRVHGTGPERSGVPCRTSGFVPAPRVDAPLGGVRDAAVEVRAIRRERDAKSHAEARAAAIGWSQAGPVEPADGLFAGAWPPAGFDPVEEECPDTEREPLAVILDRFDTRETAARERAARKLDRLEKREKRRARSEAVRIVRRGRPSTS